MGKRYICEVKKDNINNELELVNINNHLTIDDPAKPGAIKFLNEHEMHKYFNKHCISEDKLQNGNSLFMFLFFLLLIIFFVTLIYLMFNKSGSDFPSTVSKTAFGRFSF